MSENKIILCSIKRIEENRVHLDYLGEQFICSDKQISDYKVDLFSFFTINKKYKFILFDGNKISYKKLRPKLIKNKKKVVPTISQHYNLEKKLLSLLSEIEKVKAMN